MEPTQLYNSDNTPAIIEISRTQTVDVSVLNTDFVWSALEWNITDDGPADNKRITGFKIKVSKPCFLKVLHKLDTVPSVRFFQQGENSDVLQRVYYAATNLDEDGNAFAGNTAGTITAFINHKE